MMSWLIDIILDHERAIKSVYRNSLILAAIFELDFIFKNP